ncbi:ribosome recycling factor [Burkholderia multivorans]|uniref:Ribosome recycling factor n=1 Tax=Burkholderia multivorans CGD2 TaxID=513052 RepID=B9BUI9_9BURK|nr:hypothetical protein [Burkholderia multivorans]EEE05486.1 ribosome recycling factor [Burkholderia multivorans CGD2]EEE11758.1 ribosome recycling factor [Burkholderia multivorans CGD2M]MBR7896911.1 ribosome recycling factor [Burkholderia multivorans]MBU9399839.1 ribosome recycling factor [Burkholderia multivorans]MBU9589903.1 ribosome recycling factor [Burkholderia multivorans]
MAGSLIESLRSDLAALHAVGAANPAVLQKFDTVLRQDVPANSRIADTTIPVRTTLKSPQG